MNYSLSQKKLRRKSSVKRPIPIAFLVLASLITTTIISGCHRGYYRRQADAEAQRILQEKANNPHWIGNEFQIETDSRSRMNDPFSQDNPPMPLDDPAAHELMEVVDGKPGFKHWHANGDTEWAENPYWRQHLPVNEKGVVVIDLETAYRLALIHSREYQQQKETLYLSALDVTAQRFNFETQFFVPYSGGIETVGARRGGGNSQTNVDIGNGAGSRISKAGIAGSQLVVNLANSLTWQLSGPDSGLAASSLGFELVQPLLRGAGRDRVLNSLTESERTLLSNVRQMERFRRGFYLQITSGGSAGSGPSRGGGFLNTNAGGAFAGGGGVIGLLQTQQDIRIQESNVASQRSILALFEEFAAANRINLLQLQQFRTSLYGTQSRLLSAKVNYQNALDNFKIVLGLPPEIDIEIRDPLLDRFILIDDEILNRQTTLSDIQDKAGKVIVKYIQDDAYIDADIDNAGDFKWSPELEAGLKELLTVLDETEAVYEKMKGRDLDKSRDDISKFQDLTKKREQSLKELQQKLKSPEYSQGQQAPAIEPDILETVQLAETQKELDSGLMMLETRIEKVARKLPDLRKNLNKLLADGKSLKGADLKKEIEANAFGPIPKQLTEMSGIVIEVQLLQARARTDSLMLEKVDITAKEAIEIARVFRRDWMNARTSLVDVWRDIEFVANDLESQLDLVFSGDMQNIGNNITKLRPDNGRLRVGFQFDAPINRLQERNAYRQQLIVYQQARRQYYAFQDEISRQLRLITRNLELNKLNFELLRRSVRIAVQQLELARFALEEPPRPGAGASRLGSTTARDLVDALNGLQNSQLSLLNIWVNYEVLRRTLDFHLGTMQVDEDGIWIDPGEITKDRAKDVPSPYGIEPVLDGSGMKNLPGDVTPLNGIPMEVHPTGRAPLQIQGPKVAPVRVQQVPSEITLPEVDLQLNSPRR